MSPALHPSSRAGRIALPVLAALLALGLAACERDRPAPAAGSAPPATGSSPPATASASPPPAVPAAGPVILALGDSLTAGFGLPEERSYPALLQARLRERGFPHRVVNAGVSGDTTAGGLARMDWLLRQRVDILIVALGGNDGLRGLSPEAMADNLERIVARGRQAGARVILAGMKMPTNYGADFTRRYAAVFPALARRHDSPLIPFLLEGVAARPALNQPDMIHPNAAGTRIVLENVWRALEGVLER